MTRKLGVGLALAAALVGGCARGPRDRPIADHRPGGPSAATPAPYRADYALYRRDGAPNGAAVLWRGLAEGEAVGFETNAEGALAAVAGQERVPLAEGDYCWSITPETELRGVELARHDAAKAVASAGRFVGATALGVILFPFVVLWKVPVSPFPW
jgi:hypothetical protein